MLHIFVSESGHHCFRQWLVTYSAPSHYLNQYWVIVNWTPGNKLQWNFNQIAKVSILEYASENTVCEMAAILSRERWVKQISIVKIQCSWDLFVDAVHVCNLTLKWILVKRFTKGKSYWSSYSLSSTAIDTQNNLQSDTSISRSRSCLLNHLKNIFYLNWILKCLPKTVFVIPLENNNCNNMLYWTVMYPALVWEASYSMIVSTNLPSLIRSIAIVASHLRTGIPRPITPDSIHLSFMWNWIGTSLWEVVIA